MTQLFGIVCTLALFLVTASPLHAAALFFEPNRIDAAPGQQFEVAFFLDTQNEDINALEGTLVFPSDVVELKEIRDSNSIITFWIERPTVPAPSVSFSGIIPGGYRYPKGVVLSLVFEAKREATGVISLEQTRTLRNDGQGTDVPVTAGFVSFTISPELSAPPVEQITDTTPPEPFTPVLAQDPSIFDGKWFLSFATQDKGSGIDHYEIQESSFWGTGSWVKGESPYLLKRQSPTSGISVKAIDRAGNERLSVIPPSPTRPGYELGVLLGILFVAIVIILRKPIRSLMSRRPNVR